MRPPLWVAVWGALLMPGVGATAEVGVGVKSIGGSAFGMTSDWRQCPDKITSWEMFLSDKPLRCVWDHGKDRAVRSICWNRLYCSSRLCVEWDGSFAGMTCGPSVPNMICMRLTKAECTSDDYAAYCSWRGWRSSSHSYNYRGCKPLVPTWLDAATGPYKCELTTTERACRASGCMWEQHPDGPFNWCRHPQATHCRTDVGGKGVHMCRVPDP